MLYYVTVSFLHQLDQILKLQMALSCSINMGITMVTGLTWRILEKSASLISKPFIWALNTLHLLAPAVMKADKHFSWEV